MHALTEMIGIAVYVFIGVLTYRIMMKFADKDDPVNGVVPVMSGLIWPVAVPLIIGLLALFWLIQGCNALITKVSGGKI